MTEVPDKKTQEDKQPDSATKVEAVPQEAVPQEAAHHVPSNRVPVIAVSLAVLAVIGAVAASVPSFGRFARPVFKELFSSSVDQSDAPDFSRFSPPKPKRVAALPPAPVLVPDPVVRAGLRDIQSSEQQNGETLQKNTDALTALTQSTATQQADLKKITRQLALLTAQVNSLQNQPAQQPATTSSIGGPLTTSGIPRPNPRARIIHASRRVTAPAPPAVVPAVIAPVATTAPALPKPVGPVSVGGAPLSPAPASGSNAS